MITCGFGADSLSSHFAFLTFLPCSPSTSLATPEFPSLAPFIAPAKDSFPASSFSTSTYPSICNPDATLSGKAFVLLPLDLASPYCYILPQHPVFSLIILSPLNNCWQIFCNNLFNYKICFLKH